MKDKNKLHNTIKLDGETIFIHNIKQDKEKLEIFNKALQERKIELFDQTIISRLRKLYYGFLTGLIYVYYEPTNNDNIGNKAELFTHAISDKEYKLVHGKTDSTNIPFFMYGVENLDSNIWFEVKEGHKTWVYDIFSLLKIEKSIYYKLENPKVSKAIDKKYIVNHPGREEDEYNTYHNGMDFMLLKMIPEMEKKMSAHPFKDILSSEISRFKNQVDFETIKLEYETESYKKRNL